MKIELTRLDEDFHLQASNEDDLTVETDGSPAIGGHNNAQRPMQMLLASLGSCSAIDVIHLLRKQRQELRDIKITVTGERDTSKTPAPFTAIHVHYTLFGEVADNKAERAVNMSMEKLCSVKVMLEKAAEITWSWEKAA
ncbi:MAG: OsmC family protein [Phaeodactylibacter sp.]|nr:OsmC family protein [Phaeodactylibacter sp.]